MDFDPSKLSEEMKAKARACQTAEELVELAKNEGVELSIDALEEVSGGGSWDSCSSDQGCDYEFGD